MAFPPPDFRRDAIVDAAIRILDAGGVEALNMRRLAADVGLRPMTLYYHVPNKTVLLSMVIGEMGHRIVWDTYTGSPRDRLLAQAMDMYTKLDAIPWVSDVLRTGTVLGMPEFEQAEIYLSAGMELGLDHETAFGLWRTSWFLITTELQWNITARERRGDEVAIYTPDPDELTDYPAVRQLFDNWDDYTHGYRIEKYLAALIDGLAASSGGSSTDG
ncbi:TetR family transcriptional regulator [Gordonia desulfuricans]|uniref:TetR family transcriptional regulator n=1 Tax=Gordonia desulfuricans TaxID=89051 RepID=A0A7K3LP87_9ACTN|nr:TetR/AcrR family transcriptional regulator [Gordonia desulfuricans]NDK90062.1 TetR family transcriptional regulator [Gordonia desulfuricans]